VEDVTKLTYGTHDIALHDPVDLPALRERVAAALRAGADPWVTVTDHHGTEFWLLIQPGVPLVLADTSARDTAEGKGVHVFGS